MTNLLTQNIFTVLGLDSLPDDHKQQLLDKMTELVQKRLSLRLLESLSTEDGTRLEEMLKTSSMEDPAVADFFKARMPNLEDILKEEIVDLKQELLASVGS